MSELMRERVAPPAAVGRHRPPAATAPRIAVNEPGDRAERDADRAAAASLTGSGRWHADRTAAGEALARSTPAAERAADRVAALRGRGVPLPPQLRAYFEPRLGHDFGRVRVHAGAAAADATRELRARAIATADDIAFAPGRYAPQTPAGRRLIAHELAHVVQQAGGARASYGTPGPDPRAVKRDDDTHTRTVGPASEQQAEQPIMLLQRQPEDASPADAGPPAPAAPAAEPDGGATELQAAPAQPAPPTLALTPGAALTRGATLTATVASAAGAAATITDWSYVTAAHGTIVRPATDAAFQTSWSGVMAVSGELVLSYRTGATAPVRTLRQAVTVNDRTGATWTSTVTQQAEGAFAGQPSPPRHFNELGRHDASGTLPQATGTTIASGPNAQLRYVSALTAGTFTSAPLIHPNLTNASSAFYTFHTNPSRLYFVVGAARTLIPLAQYSALSVAGGTVTFTVPDWEAFYKRHRYYTVTATATGGAPVTLTPAMWRLASNAENADVEIADEPAVRAALGITANQGYTYAFTARGAWEGYQLMQAAAILAGTRSHEYAHAVHSHRANFLAMMRALDPQRKIESRVGAPATPVDFGTLMSTWWTEILRPDHELVDEAASRTAEAFVAAAGTMAGINTDPASGAFLGSVWDITGDQQMT